MRKHHHMSSRRKKAMPVPAPGEIFINKNYCDGCGECVSNCPNNVLKLKEISAEDYNKLTIWGAIKSKNEREGKIARREYRNLCILRIM